MDLPQLGVSTRSLHAGFGPIQGSAVRLSGSRGGRGSAGGGMVAEPVDSIGISRYITFSRDEWARLRAATPLPLTEAELAALRGINDRLSLEEVADIFLPLSRLLNLYVAASQNLYMVTDTFLGS